MKALHLVLAAASISVLSGCNFYLADLFHDSPRQANNGFKYLSSDPDQKKFLVDESRNNFNFNSKYYIKGETENPDNALIGRSVDITTPVQITSVIPGSVTSVRDNHAYLLINTADYDYQGIDNILMERLLTYLAKRDISVESVDSLNSTITTGWYSSDYGFAKIPPEKLAEDDEIIEYRTKFNISFRKPNDRLMQMDVELTNFKAYHESRRIYLDPSSFVQNRFASLFLNDYLSTFVSQTMAGADFVPVDATYHSVTLGRDANKQYCWQIAGSFDAIWPKFVKMLPKYGFAVLFEEKIRGIVDTNYDEEDEEFFQAQGIDNFVIEDDKYRFQVGVKGNDTTIITIFNNSKQPLSDELFLKMYGGFAKALEKELN